MAEIVEKVEGWLVAFILGKGVKSAAKAIVSWCFAHGLVIACQPYGVQIDTTNEGVLAVGINSLLKMAFAWLKKKYPEKFGWLP